RRRHTRSTRDWSSDVCSSDLAGFALAPRGQVLERRVVQLVRVRRSTRRRVMAGHARLLSTVGKTKGPVVLTGPGGVAAARRHAEIGRASGREEGQGTVVSGDV